MIGGLVALAGLVLPSGLAPAAADVVILKEDYQVLQRDAQDQASCMVALPEGTEPAATFLVRVQDVRGRTVRQGDARPTGMARGAQGVVIEKLAVGGPYTITVADRDDPARSRRILGHILVGDLWILGGQSNMFGIDVLKEDLPALPSVNMLNVLHVEKDAHWCAAVPPIHRIPEPFASFTLKSQHPEYTPERIRQIIAAQTPVGGIDCSYFFARKLSAESGVPIGLIPCATGGALAIWDPKDRDRNRYGFLAHHVMSAGGRVKGLLFFQGEQDAIFGDEQRTVTKPSLIGPLTSYGEKFGEFMGALRSDFRSPDMPVIFAQICRHHNGPSDRAQAWELVRETQRLIPERLAHAHCVPSIDLDVMDGLHLDYDSLKRMGERMAYLALPYVKKGVAPRTEIKLRSVTYRATPKPAIVVEFGGVTGKLRAPGRPTGFHLKKKGTGELVDWIYKVDFDPARPHAVTLRTTSGPDPNVLLYYGPVAAPYVNLTDDNDMPVPAFGPIEVK